LNKKKDSSDERKNDENIVFFILGLSMTEKICQHKIEFFSFLFFEIEKAKWVFVELYKRKKKVK
jgi:hypothetical protein